MRSYSLEAIEKLAADTGMRICMYDDTVQVFLGNFRISLFKKTYKGMPLYELIWTYTKVSEYHIVGNINFTDGVIGARFFGDLHTVYENMSKKYRELLKTIKATEIKNCGTEFEI